MWGCFSQLLCLDSLFPQGLVSVIHLPPTRGKPKVSLTDSRILHGELVIHGERYVNSVNAVLFQDIVIWKNSCLIDTNAPFP